MKVLSLFDGISCGRVALERAGIAVECYYASEIDKYATAVS
ncbi:MAG: DNA cytosine methyltransferase, partial [Christensenellales bacterium]